MPLEENINRRALEEGSVEARTIEDAIAVLRYCALSCQVSLSSRETLVGAPSPRIGSLLRFACDFLS